MGPKEKKEGKRSGLTADETSTDSVFQAVVLADSFNKRFRPLTLEKPRCLLPLANVPLIEYTLEFLARGGVQEVFVIACAHTDQIETYIRESKWSKDSSPFNVTVTPTPSSSSAGDVMRDLDMRGILTTDFLLVSGDVVSNMSLEPIIEAHRQRRAIDKNAIMTMVLREASPTHRIRAKGASGIFVLDKTGTRCLMYEQLRRGHKQNISVTSEILKEHKDVQIRNDLVDCYVDVVSLDVLALFTENFDYQQLRRDFLRGILSDELYGKTIHCHIVENDYAARVRSLRTYDAVSRDIISRWTYPFCPDSNMADNTYRYQQGHIYREDGVVLAQSCTINHRSVIGSGTSIGGGAIITESIIGRNCSIGKNAVITGAYIWDDVSIGNDCKVTSAIVGGEASLGDRCEVAPGAIISYGVVIGGSTQISGDARISRSDNDMKANQGLVGKGGIGHMYEDSEDEDSDDREEIENSRLNYGLATAALSDDSISSLSDREDVKKPAFSVTPGGHRRRPSQHIPVEESEDDTFYREAFTQLLSSIENEHPVEVIGLELNSLRMTANAPFNQVRRAFAAAIMTRVEHLMSQNEATTTKAVKIVIPRLAPLFKRMVFDKNDQVDLLKWLQKDLVQRSKGPAIMQATAFEMYHLDLLDEEAVKKWWTAKDEDPEDTKRVALGCQDFVNWLEEAEEEEDESEDEDDEDEDDD